MQKNKLVSRINKIQNEQGMKGIQDIIKENKTNKIKHTVDYVFKIIMIAFFLMIGAGLIISNTFLYLGAISYGLDLYGCLFTLVITSIVILSYTIWQVGVWLD